MASVSGEDPHLCMLKRVTGVPCPTCGSTRLAFRLIHGDPAGALRMNPLVFAAAAVFGALLLLKILAGRGIEIDLSKAGRRAAWTLAVAALLANWAWVIWRVG